MNFNDGFCIEQAEEALRFCNSYDRLPTLLDLSVMMDDSEWLFLLGREWSGCDNISEHSADLFDAIFNCGVSVCPSKEMMTNEEQDFYDALPDLVTVYRGCYTPNKWGFCWTLDINIAMKFPFFARYRMDGQPLLVKALAKKENIIAVKTDRGEAEIITLIRPKHISTRHIR